MKAWPLVSAAIVLGGFGRSVLEAAELELPQPPPLAAAAGEGAASAAVPDLAAVAVPAALAAPVAAPAAPQGLAALPDLRAEASLGSAAVAASFDGSRLLAAPGSLVLPLPGPAEPRLSLARARAHGFKRWRGAAALRVPLALSDHAALMAGAFAAPTVVTTAAGGALSLLLLWTAQVTPLGAVVLAAISVAVGAVYLGPVLASGHFKESRDGAAVARNARRHVKGGSPRWDPRIIGYARRFEAETGWKIAWTESRHVLALAEPDSKRVLLSIGWVLESPEKRDRRRIAYFWDTVNVRLAQAAKHSGR